jgi:hypothetical protein
MTLVDALELVLFYMVLAALDEITPDNPLTHHRRSSSA